MSVFPQDSFKLTFVHMVWHWSIHLDTFVVRKDFEPVWFNIWRVLLNVWLFLLLSSQLILYNYYRALKLFIVPCLYPQVTKVAMVQSKWKITLSLVQLKGRQHVLASQTVWMFSSITTVLLHLWDKVNINTDNTKVP